jgi:hypothetical protein
VQFCEPAFFPYDCPSTPTPPKQSKRQRNLEQLSHARDSKLKKISEEEQLADLEEHFWEGAADDIDLDSKQELYVMAMRKLDENWTYQDVSKVTGIAYNTLKTYQGFWKTLSEKDFKFHVQWKKRGRQLFQPLSLLKMQNLSAEIMRNEDAQLVSSQRSSFNHVILPILIDEAVAAGSQSLCNTNDETDSTQAKMRVLLVLDPKQPSLEWSNRSCHALASKLKRASKADLLQESLHSAA